jgi:hypothetical protein
MTPVQKYRLYTVFVLIGSFYILLTEAWDRWSNTLQEATSLSEKTLRVMSPEEAARRKLELQSELVTLRSLVIKCSQGFDQSEAGLVELVGESAKKDGVKIEALTPTKLEEGGGITLSIELLGSFHRIGGFLNNLENAPVPLKLQRLEVGRDTGKILHVKMTLKAAFLRLGQKQ